MSSTYGENLKISIFGQSHSEAIGVVIDGLPAGFEVDMDELGEFLSRRAPGQGKHTTSRKEPDRPEFLSGLAGGKTCGAPLAALIRNTNTRSSDYDNIRDIPRPGHADFAARIKYGGAEDVSGGGHFSGRLTAPLCIAGGIALQILREKGITVKAEIKEIGGKSDGFLETVEEARLDADSVGGIIECVIEGVPAGYGNPMFGGVENKIASCVFGIPAVKGVEFGAGFEAARMRGSENNDEFYYEEDGRVRTRTNNHGGILGGITTGMPIVFRTAFKPTPSIGKPQKSISFSEKKDAVLEIKGRHDPCVVMRAAPCVEAAAAITVLDIILGGKN
jgi:chorismate synthase